MAVVCLSVFCEFRFSVTCSSVIVKSIEMLNEMHPSPVPSVKICTTRMLVVWLPSRPSRNALRPACFELPLHNFARRIHSYKRYILIRNPLSIQIRNRVFLTIKRNKKKKKTNLDRCYIFSFIVDLDSYECTHSHISRQSD